MMLIQYLCKLYLKIELTAAAGAKTTHLTLVNICVHGHMSKQVFSCAEGLFAYLTLVVSLPIGRSLPFLHDCPKAVVFVKEVLKTKRIKVRFAAFSYSKCQWRNR